MISHIVILAFFSLSLGCRTFTVDDNRSTSVDAAKPSTRVNGAFLEGSSSPAPNSSDSPEDPSPTSSPAANSGPCILPDIECPTLASCNTGTQQEVTACLNRVSECIRIRTDFTNQYLECERLRNERGDPLPPIPHQRRRRLSPGAAQSNAHRRYLSPVRVGL